MREVRALATDGVILVDGEVVLMERDHGQVEGHWVLPGGYVEPDERAREACVREVREEVGLSVVTDAFVGLYDDPDRDERGNVSVAYRCRPTDPDPEPQALEEARRVDTFAPEAIDDLAMGYDHREIVTDALELADG